MTDKALIQIDIIAGARPNFIKIAPLMHKLKTHSKFDVRLIHTGQHYDTKMSAAFFKQLDIPEPNVNLAVGNGTQAEQAGGIMIKYEHYLIRTYKPNLCMVVGDVTSTMACAIVAKKEGIKVAHIEAGLRSGDFNMPEEINRILTDSITDYYFTTTKNASMTLLNEGVKPANIFFVGNIMIDTLRKFESKFYAPKVWKEENLQTKNYFVLTLHRPSNVDDDKRFIEILSILNDNVSSFKLIYPVHPRVVEKLKKSSQLLPNIFPTAPLPYLEFNYLVKNAKAVITDSGGITEETTVYGIPCMTIRDNTERPETVTIGTNKLLKQFPRGIKDAFSKVNSNSWKKGDIPEKWDGKTAKRIVKHLDTIFR